MEIAFSYAWRKIDVLPPRILPPQSLVLALSPLLDGRVLGALTDLRARGFDLAIVDVSPFSHVRPLPGEGGAVAFRLWRLWRETLHDRYRRLGVPVVDWRRRGRHRRRPGGGEDVQAPRPKGPQLIAAVAAVLCEAGLAAFPLLRAGTLRALVLAAGMVALALLLLALAGFVAALPWSLGLVAAEFVLIDTARSEPVLATPLFGAGLLLVAELAYASRELARGAEERTRRRVLWLAAVAAAALVAASFPAVASGIAPPSGLAAALIALGASAVLLLPVVLLVRGPARR